MGLRRLFKNVFRDKTPTVKYIRNLYDTKYGRTVLISYIVHPFLEDANFKHQNFVTAHIVAKSFSALEYDVDVVDFRAQVRELDFCKYDVIFGFGNNFELSFYGTKPNVPKIHFITGAHTELHNQTSLRSVFDFYNLTDLWLPSEANVSDHMEYYALYASTFSIILAEGFVFQDFKDRYQKKVYSLNNNILGVFKDHKAKSIENRSQEFLFLSGGKQITKGLFYVLEIARYRKDLKFHVIVPNLDERMANHYADLWVPDSNVSLYVDIRMDSVVMRSVIESCSYCLAPSYIDGFPGGTIEPMAAGLIPIVSKYCGFPSRDFIFEMKDLTVSALNLCIDNVLAMTDIEYLKKSREVKEYIMKEFSAPYVEQNLKNILSTELIKPKKSVGYYEK